MKSHLKKKMKSYVSNTTDKVQEEKDDIKEVKYPVCEEKHDMDNRKQFNNMSVDERSKMLRRKTLSYGCYLPVSPEHTAKTCKKRRIWDNDAPNWIAWVCTQMERWWSS